MCNEKHLLIHSNRVNFTYPGFPCIITNTTKAFQPFIWWNEEKSVKNIFPKAQILAQLRINFVFERLEIVIYSQHIVPIHH